MLRVIEPPYHVPEAELHAYLDQALSRSQCVDIEHHLAECRSCQAQRDTIAALRDRTTSLLVAAAPRRIRPRPFVELSGRAARERAAAARRLRYAAWAASIVAALGLGWGLGHLPGAATSSPPIALRPIDARVPTGLNPWTGSYPRGSTPVAQAARFVPAADRRPQQAAALPGGADASVPPASTTLPRPAASELAAVGGTATAQEPLLEGVWRTVPLTPTGPGRSEWVPRVDGVPVVQVKVREAPHGGRPITLVTQQLANGEMISTVEGPSPDVAELLSRQPVQSASAELQDMQALPPAVDTAGAQRPAAGAAPRTLAVFGSVPADSLKAFMLRVK